MGGAYSRGLRAGPLRVAAVTSPVLVAASSRSPSTRCSWRPSRSPVAAPEARALARLVPDCLVLARGLLGDREVPGRCKLALAGLVVYLARRSTSSRTSCR